MSPISDEPTEPKTPAEKPPAYGFIVFAGILLPLITLIVELSTGLCAGVFFDPVPSIWHILVVGLVPLANARLLWALDRNRLERRTFLFWISTIAAGASIFYSLLFLPISPLSVIGIIYFGLGLLPLAPFFSLWTTLLLRKYLLQNIDAKPFPMTWTGLLTGFLIVLGIVGLSEARYIVTRYGLEKAASPDFEKQAEGLKFLRVFGNEDYILQLANSNRKRFYISDYLVPGEMASGLAAREVYYRLTGKTFDSSPAPVRRSLFDDGEEGFPRAMEVSLDSSQLDGSIDNDASLGYLEWTFSLKNDSQYRDMEGFTQIQLPPGAVVSRLTLWINGEEREAAFAEQSRVTKAYEQVTALKRDPVLVTTAGRDRVNLKCFPIPQKGGTMKMRLGITFPLILEDEKNGLVRLPYFRDKNFKIPETLQHAVRIESKGELRSANRNLVPETKENLFAVRGALSDKEIVDSISSIRAVKSDALRPAWTKDDEDFVAQRIIEIPGVKPARFVFVVDTSATMKNEQPKLVAALQNLPAETEVALVLANGSGLNRELVFPRSFTGKPSEIAEKIKQADFDGGVDNLPALTKGWELAGEKPNSAMIWVHAPQPYRFNSSPKPVQGLTRQTDQAVIYSLSTGNGLDVIEKELDNLKHLQTVPRFGDLRQDLERLILQLDRAVKSFDYERVHIKRLDVKDGKETSSHLLRLWANDEVKRILAAGGEDQKAVNLAVKYQLVTPVTGAVVLETKEQYDQFGLHPVDKNTVPTIPEPEFYLLLAVVFGVLIWLFATRKLF